jgi:hypothetical protein
MLTVKPRRRKKDIGRREGNLPTENQENGENGKSPSLSSSLAASLIVPPSKWSKPSKVNPESIKRNVYCEICHDIINALGSEEIKNCNYCNVAVHESCLKGKYLCKLSKLDWICPFCVESIEYEKQTFRKKRDKINTQKRLHDCQTIISKNWRRYRQRKAYRITIKLIVRLQMAVRLRFTMKKFILQRKEKLRPLGISITSCTIGSFDRDRLSTKINFSDKNNDEVIVRSLSKDIYILITVLYVNNELFGDNITKKWQTTVLCSYSEISSENKSLINLRFDSFTMLGGVAGVDTIVFTVVQSSGKSSNKDIFLGQASVDMESYSLWTKGGKLNLKLHDMEFLLNDNNGAIMDFLYPSKINSKSKDSINWGNIAFSVDVYYGMNADCGWIYASAIDELARVVKKLPNCYNPAFPLCVPKFDLESTSTAVAAERKNGHKLIQIFPKFVMKKTWACIANNYIYLYMKFGEHPRIILNLSLLDLKVDNVPGQKSYSFCFESSGYPEVRLSNYFPEEELKWKITFLASKMSVDECNGTKKFDHEKLCENLKKYRKICLETKFVRKSGLESNLNNNLNKKRVKSKSKYNNKSSISNHSESSITDTDSLTNSTNTDTSTKSDLLISNVYSYEIEDNSNIQILSDSRESKKVMFGINSLASTILKKL